MELQHWYDLSGVAGVPARSPRSADSPESPRLAKALLVGAAAVPPAGTPPDAEAPQWLDDVLPS